MLETYYKYFHGLGHENVIALYIAQVPEIYSSKQTESEGVAQGRYLRHVPTTTPYYVLRTRFVYYSHKSLATCTTTLIYPT